jgi:hypothetical protein
MLFPTSKNKEHYIQKEASLVGLGLGIAATEAAAEGLKHFGRARGANFLDAGIQLGQKGEKMNPYTEGMARNLFGNKQLAPYDAGLEIGSRMKNMEPERGERFLNKAVGMGSARKERLEAAGEKVKNPVLNALDKYQIGADRSHPLFQSTIMKGSKPKEANPLLGELGATATSAPLALADVRSIVRPALRAAEKNPSIQKTQTKLFPEGTKREKTYNVIRDYID